MAATAGLLLGLLITAALLVQEVRAADLTASWVDNSFGTAITRVERRADTEADFTAIADVPPGITVYIDASVSSGSSYCYRALAYDDEGESPYSEEACGTAIDRLNLAINRVGSGAGTVVSTPAGISCGSACSAIYLAGSPVTLAATSGPGSIFNGWNGGSCSGTAPCTFAGNSPVTVTATFSEVFYDLTIAKAGTGTGTVTSGPAGITCGAQCATNYRGDTSVTLTAMPASGSVFAGWAGACTGTGACTVAMTGPATATATFRAPLSGRCTPGPGEVGLAYSASCSIAGGLPPYSCTVATGILPLGVALGGDCSIAGTPTTPGAKAFTARVADAAGAAVNATGRLAIMGGVSITTATLPRAVANQSFSTTLAAAAGLRPYAWTITSGALPDGLALSPLGRITGRAPVTGVSPLTVQVRDALGKTAERPMQLVVNRGPLAATCSPAAGEVDIPYSASCTPRAGLAPYTCALVSGTPPAGLTLNSDCSITGTPTTAGTGAFRTQVADSGGMAVTIGGRVTIRPHVAVTTAVLPKATVNRSFVTTLVAAGGVRPYTWALTAGSLPVGVTLNATLGRITGLPTELGVSSFTVRVSDALGATADRPLQLVVNRGPLTATCTSVAGEVDIAYAGSCTPRAGLAPYTCALVSGTPPAGLTLNSDCSITGAPTTAGTGTFRLQVADSGNMAVTITGRVTIQPHVAVTTSVLPAARVNRAYTTTLVAAGGQRPFQWAISAGSLPAGVTLDATLGKIIGTPTVSGISDFTVQVTDAHGATDQQALQLVVNP